LEQKEVRAIWRGCAFLNIAADEKVRPSVHGTTRGDTDRRKVVLGEAIDLLAKGEVFFDVVTIVGCDIV
jgi:hypothetical protein